MNETKKTIRTNLAYFSIHEIVGKIDDIISLLNDYKTKYPDYDILRLDYDDEDFDLYGEKLETDEAFNARIEKEEARKKAKLEEETREWENRKIIDEAKEFGLYQRLKKKYEATEID